MKKARLKPVSKVPPARRAGVAAALIAALRWSLAAPNPAQVTVGERLRMMRDYASSEPTEFWGAVFKLGYGCFFAPPWSRALAAAPGAYGWMGHAGAHIWGGFMIVTAGLQLWANLWRQTRGARLLCMVATEPFVAIFAAVCFTTELGKGNLWSPLWWVYTWLTLQAWYCIWRLSGQSTLPTGTPIDTLEATRGDVDP